MKRSRNSSAIVLVQDQPRAGDAGLALIVEDGAGGAADRGGNVGVLEDDVGTFAAELELHLLQVAGRRLDDAPPGRGRAGESDFLTSGCSAMRGPAVWP